MLIQLKSSVQPNDMKNMSISIAYHCLFTVETKRNEIYIIFDMAGDARFYRMPCNYFVTKTMPVLLFELSPWQLAKPVQCVGKSSFFFSFAEREAKVVVHVAKRKIRRLLLWRFLSRSTGLKFLTFVLGSFKAPFFTHWFLSELKNIPSLRNAKLSLHFLLHLSMAVLRESYFSVSKRRTDQKPNKFH